MEHSNPAWLHLCLFTGKSITARQSLKRTVLIKASEDNSTDDSDRLLNLVSTEHGRLGCGVCLGNMGKLVIHYFGLVCYLVCCSFCGRLLWSGMCVLQGRKRQAL